VTEINRNKAVLIITFLHSSLTSAKIFAYAAGLSVFSQYHFRQDIRLKNVHVQVLPQKVWFPGGSGVVFTGIYALQRAIIDFAL